MRLRDLAPDVPQHVEVVFVSLGVGCSADQQQSTADAIFIAGATDSPVERGVPSDVDDPPFQEPLIDPNYNSAII